MATILKSCDFIIYLTEGNSFTDIYGQDRFNDLTLIKERPLRVSPVILGPQTYGPLNDSANEKRAADTIRRAETV